MMLQPHARVTVQSPSFAPFAGPSVQIHPATLYLATWLLQELGYHTRAKRGYVRATQDIVGIMRRSPARITQARF